MIRYLAWSLFLLVTLGTIDVHIYYRDGFSVEYDNWLDKLIDKMEQL
jgi:hypothetical protein